MGHSALQTVCVTILTARSRDPPWVTACRVRPNGCTAFLSNTIDKAAVARNYQGEADTIT